MFFLSTSQQCHSTKWMWLMRTIHVLPQTTISLSLRFNGHLPGEPGLAGVYWSKGWWKWWWQLEAGAVGRAKLQWNHYHQQTNIQFFTGRMPFLSPNQQCHRTEGKSTERKLQTTKKRYKVCLSHEAHQLRLTSNSTSLSHTPTKTARSWTRGQSLYLSTLAITTWYAE